MSHIAEHALLSDCQGSALVTRRGSVDWACLPRFDSPSVFCRILDPRGGHWAIDPGPTATTRRSYVEGTMVLRTEHATPTGRVEVLDALALGPLQHGHHIGVDAPHVLVRVVHGIEGSVDLDVDFAPRLEYGITVPAMSVEPGGATTRGGPLSLVLSTSAPLRAAAGHVGGHLAVLRGERVRFALQVGSPWGSAPAFLDADEIDALLAGTVSAWRSWSDLHPGTDGPYRDLVRHSGRVLQALTYAPTGAIVAAPTTSLPEQLGGARNWDYRFCWVRDASLTLEALWVAACPHEAASFFDFFATAAGSDVDGASGLQILYGVGGERHVPESALAHLAGHRDSRPVRVGNGAWDQLQLDVYGELLSAAWLLSDQVGTFDAASSRLLVAAADTAARRWREPDEGIWEVRGARRHFLYSKLMCWVALDRACRLAPRIGAEERRAGWQRAAAEIRAAILASGWSREAGAFTQSFGSTELDASALMVPIVGFLPPGDPRVLATVEAVARRLTDRHGFVYRYLGDDGLDGGEGTFTICTYWLVQALAMTGQVERARALFDAVTASANDVGLLSEQIDPSDGTMLGNFPQAFTHIGLVNAAWAITCALRARDDRTATTAR